MTAIIGSETRMAAATTKRILFLAPQSTYRLQPFLEAAQRLGVEISIGNDRCHVLAEQWPVGPIALDFRDAETAAQQIYAQTQRFDAIIAADDHTAVIAAKASRKLGLPHNAVDSVYAARNKYVMRQLLASSKVLSPSFKKFSCFTSPHEALAHVAFPCVLKPLLLSGSRGVVRANNGDEFIAAFQRLKRLLTSREFFDVEDAAAREILVEKFIPGFEVAVEALLLNGRLQPLALFDKPDPLDGPFFEETIYVTPSRLSSSTQEKIFLASAQAAAALGLKHGPVHAELRLNEKGVWVIEIAARTIGGLCSRTLRFGTGFSLEEVVLRHALGVEIKSFSREAQAAGVMMIPIPRRGELHAVEGVNEARALPGIEEITITAKTWHLLVPLPEGASYLGFIFARGQRQAEVEAALRAAHRCLQFDIRPTLPVED